MKKFPLLSVEILESISRVLGDSFRGLNDEEIARYLAEAEIPDVMPLAPRWIRIYNAFADIQKNKDYSNHIIAFIHKVMKPADYRYTLALFKWRKENLNEKLVFAGLELGNNGRLKVIKPQEYVNQAKERINELKIILAKRNYHNEIFKSCRPELVLDNYFPFVFEAVQSIVNRIHELSGLKEHGIELVNKAFTLDNKNKPLLALNPLQSEGDYFEHHSFVSLLKGLFGQFQQPSASKPLISWKINLDDAIDILALVSMIHKKLDNSYIYIG